jgi:hypothetical protein
VALYDVPPDATGTLSFSNPATVTTNVPGQNAQLTFEAQAGGRISLNVSNVSYASARVSVVRPDGERVVAPTLFGTAGGFIDVKQLVVDGVYRVVIDPQSAATGSLTVTVYDVPPDVSGTLAIGGAAFAVALATPGQNARLSFDGSSGARVNVKLSAVTFSSSLVSVLRPDGRPVAPAALVGPTGKTLSFTLPDAGTYALVVDPRLAATGTALVAITAA